MLKVPNYGIILMLIVNLLPLERISGLKSKQMQLIYIVMYNLIYCQMENHQCSITQYGFRGIGAPNIKEMYELSAPDSANCSPGLAKCAPSHK